MSRRDARRASIDAQLEAVRRGLREHHANVEPDAFFAARVTARLPQREGWPLAWAVMRVLPVSVAVALALLVVVLVTPRSGSPSATLTASASASQDDLVGWVLGSRDASR